MNNKKIISCFLIFFTFYISLAQTTAVPDSNFENYLETHTIDGTIVSVGDVASMGDGIAENGIILTARIGDVTFLDVRGLGISDLTGIEDFTVLETLICSNNNLSALNISDNIKLESLLCSTNNISELILNENINLETLDCSDNQIQSLDILNNSVLTSLTVSGNQLLSLDVSNNSDLTFLSVSDNRISGELIVSNNIYLESLFCSSNQISTLNLLSNTFLKNLDASDNVLVSLDLSAMNAEVCPEPQTEPVTKCQGLSTVNVSRNQLNLLIAANGYNELFSIFNTRENPDLFCIQIDAGFTPSSWIKDGWTYYSENPCMDIYTYVPDSNFEQALIDLGLDDADGLDNLVLTANINTITSLDIANKSISSVVGIEDFISLEILDCGTNTIQILDLSNNVALLEIDVTNNNLEVLDLTENIALTSLKCAINSIENLDLSTNAELLILNCSNNVLTSLNLNPNILLSEIDCSFNQIESLNVTSNSSLASVLCNDNNLFELNISNGTNNSISIFNTTNNEDLFCIGVDDVAFANSATGWQKDATAEYNSNCGTYIPDDNFEQKLIDLGIDSDNTLNNFVATADINTLIALDISGLEIADLTGIEDFIALQNLNCSNNNLISLDLSTNIDLEILDCSDNQIEELDVTINTALTSLMVNTNALKTLNIKNGSNDGLAVFNALNNANLYCINIDDALVGNIPGSWQKDTIASYNGDCYNNRITLIPDTFFEQALIDLNYDDVIDGEVLTSNIEHVLLLNVSDESISDLEGIQDFQSLKELDCSGNDLDALDVSDMINLERLNCSSNYLQTNDINSTNGLLNTTGTISLIELYCASNNLNNLNTSQNINLELLDCADNNISVLNLDSNISLRILNCIKNDLTSLNISNNVVLEDVNCNNNQLTDLSTIGVNNNTLTNLSCANNNLTTLQISNYKDLTTLNVGSNELTQLDVSSNVDLSFLSITNNQISEIDLSNNTNLLEALVSQNSLTQIDVTTNTNLENLNCAFNDLIELDLNSNTALQILDCSDNQLTELDLRSTINLIDANFSANTLTSITLSNTLGTLKRLNASNNQIEGNIDLTTMATSACIFQSNQEEFCPQSISINLANNLLIFVDIQNGINAEIANFNSTGNPNLTCVQVDDENTIGSNWIKDEATNYRTNCNFGETFVPDDNFEQALIELGYDSGPLDDYVLTAAIDGLKNLDVSGKLIADMEGIQDFVALENLNCSNNILTELDVANNIALSTINCSGNAISSLDLVTNTNLSNLNIANNTFLSFSPIQVPSLQTFNCDFNQIIELDFQQNPSLTNLSCQSNLLDILNVRNGQNATLGNLNAQNNPDLVCVETDNGSAPSGATWLIDDTAQFAIECFFGETFVPDDNFEQALIDFGYDSGPLDDYVVTEIIEVVNFLNISNLEIADLTGIEAFLSLTTLNFEENNIAIADLSNNINLVNLDASENLLTDFDITLLPNLMTLDVSNNSLIQLNFDLNFGLVDLNISGNQFTNLNVDDLSSLQELNCSFNQLTSLSLVQNSNLTVLFCQSNMFINDQLNLQNGNNQNLRLFNAIDNPDLGCILVDNPVEVISNTDGTYDNWIKDNSASYQTVCEDADNDGIPNVDDLCPATEFGATVDLFGCPIINLPNDNFNILVTGETCLNSNNGKITIVAQELYNYTVSLERDSFFQEYNFTNDVDIFNLLAGTYQMCITIEEWPDYQICYAIVITQPDPLEVFSSRAESGDVLSLNMTGNSNYNIEFNGKMFTTYNPSLMLNLKPGINTLKVSTDIACQGVYEEIIYVTETAFVFPNPFNDQINIYTDREGEEVSIRIFSMFGQLVLNRTFKDQNNTIKLDSSELESGMYIMTVESKTLNLTYKIIKE